jgi:uncharacterized protein YchJ
MNTHHSKTRGEVNQSDVEVWAKNSQWKGLEIQEKQEGQAADSKGTILFCARYERG